MPATPASNFSFRKAWPWLLAAAVVGIATGVAGVWLYGIADKKYREAELGSAVMAKNVCSGVFVSHRKLEDILATDLSGPPYERLTEFKPKVDQEAKRVTASYCLFGPKFPISCLIGTQTAIFRDGLGCTVVDTTEQALRAQSPGLPPAPASNPEALWPEGERVDLEAIPPGVDGAALKAAVEAAFIELDEKHPRRTRALVVVYDGRIVAEKYAPGFDAKMPLTGWSMAKSATNTLIGLRVKDGKLALADRDLLREWREEGNQRRRDITLDQLLHMTSGLAFSEDYKSDDGDVLQMLYIQGDKSEFAAKKDLNHTPGTYWDYSSGTTNIIARVLRRTFADEDDQGYLRYPRERLFEPLGMSSAVFEPDAAGILVGSSYLYATARDWARLGLLYLRDGVWQGARLLPEGWVAESLKPAPHAPDARYAAQIWLKLDEAADSDSLDLGEPPLPDDTYYMLGHDGQIVAIVPSRDLVIVRLGLSRDSAWHPAPDLAPIVQAFPPRT
jgi:CubicO group peptidase (beta-lactamase class C family)